MADFSQNNCLFPLSLLEKHYRQAKKLLQFDPTGLIMFPFKNIRFLQNRWPSITAGSIPPEAMARITSEGEGMNRVLYDPMPKGPGTIEWE